jgi:hypothetical protein
MDQNGFLETHVFSNLKGTTNGVETNPVYFFTEADFEVVLERIEHFGISVYSIEPFLDGKSFGIQTNEDLKKKATDVRWYGKAFSTFKHQQAGMLYSATYKVPSKLLARYS